MNGSAANPEEPGAPDRPETAGEAERPAARRPRFGCLLRVAAIIAVVLTAFVVLGLIFGGGDGGPGTSGAFDAGDAELYLRGDVTYLEFQNIYVSRLADGTFFVLYDLSPKQQELGSDCRIRYDESATLSALPQLEGFRGAFVEDCEDRRTVWRADGQFDSGAGYGDLDRFQTRIGAGGELIIDLDERTCTRSRGVPGIPPYDVRTCRRP